MMQGNNLTLAILSNLKSCLDKLTVLLNILAC